MTDSFIYDTHGDEVPKHATNIIVSSNMTKISAKAFYKRTSLSGITIPQSVATIGKQAFMRCSSLTSITLPASLTNLGYRTFSKCTALTSITILSTSLSSIEHLTFQGCTALTSITLPSSLNFIQDDAFEYCPSLSHIDVPSSLPYLILSSDKTYGGLNINENLRSLYHVLIATGFFSKISFPSIKRLGLGIAEHTKEKDDYYYYTALVNWNVCANMKHRQDRWTLFTAIERNLTWSEGLCEILKHNGAAIEDVDTVTNLEAFMLAGVGPNSDLETVFMLLQDHPGAIIPYV